MEKGKIIGVTGKIGSGKSTFSKFFFEKGFEVVDADFLSKEIRNEKEVADLIFKNFGSNDPKILRERMSDLYSRQFLEDLIRPRVRERLRHLKKIHRKLVIEAIFLDPNEEFDLCIEVCSSIEIRKKRLKDRNLSETEIDRWIDLQKDLNLGRVDLQIQNNDDLESLKNAFNSLSLA